MGNFFSNHKFLYDKFLSYYPTFDFYINIVKNINTNEANIKDEKDKQCPMNI